MTKINPSEDKTNHLPYLKYEENLLHINNRSILNIIKEVPTPFFIFLPKRFEHNYNHLKSAFDKYIPSTRIAYAIKANYLGRILQHANGLEMTTEAMSLFELLLAERAGFSFDRVIFNGPAKTQKELEFSMDKGIQYLNIESMNELRDIENIAEKKGIVQDITIRIHPRLSEETEKKLLIKKNSKLGIDYDRAMKLYKYAKNSSNLKPKGVHVHVGTNIVSHDFYDELLEFLNDYIKDLSKKHEIEIEQLNLGGGMASKSKLDENGFNLERYAEQISVGIDNIENITVLLEPGRYLIEDSFIAVAKVLRTKSSWGRKWAFTDIGANTLIPMRYSNYEAIPLEYKGEGPYCRIGGPLCLPVDVISNESVSYNIEEEDRLAILNCGAYTLSMSEQFGYPRPAVYELKNENELRMIKDADNIQDMVEEAFNFKTESLL
ncbi:MAG: alanine racemase [Candidatus Heimdallarchaeota archaeon]|nr:alanine racemase [Candidatus Heimdallarchaeota archaeon]